jgi:hypothetical protein
LQDLFKKLDAEKEKSGAPTGKMKK